APQPQVHGDLGGSQRTDWWHVGGAALIAPMAENRCLGRAVQRARGRRWRSSAALSHPRDLLKGPSEITDPPATAASLDPREPQTDRIERRDGSDTDEVRGSKAPAVVRRKQLAGRPQRRWG